MTRVIICLLALLCTVGCAADWKDGDEHFFVTHKGVSMPVWVTGNWRANHIIVHVHGGPGSTNMIYYQKSSYQRLAADVGIAYYEQRASGSTLGSHRDLDTIDQWVEDLGVVMTVLENRYPKADFVLMGHSFGGHLGPKFLLAGNQSRFKGWIEQDGEHDSSCRMWNYARDRVLEIGAAQVESDPRKADYWNEARRFYAEDWKCDVNTNENNLIEEVNGIQVQLQHSLYVRAAGGYDVMPDRVLNNGDILEILFRSQFDIFAVTKNMPYPLKGLFGVDLTPRLAEIKLPVLMLWGVHDLATPYTQAAPGLAAYGAPTAQKRLVSFDDSGHNPWAEEPDKFYSSVRSFLDGIWPGLP
jgi:pimeloyl-ACP methyl ester carboxylesterase